MKYIISYYNFNESKGISDSCEIVLYKIWSKIENNIINSISNDIVFDINELDFKCKNIILKYNISKGEDNICNGLTILNNSKIIDNILNDITINIDIIVNDMDDEFIYYIKSVILHELLHIFQHYNIRINNKFRPESFSIGSILPQLKQNVSCKYSKYLLDVLYYSLSHELSAQLHQYYLYKISGREYKRINFIIDLLSKFKIIDLSEEDDKEITYIRNHVVNSIKYLATNKKYLKNIDSSIWSTGDNVNFLKNIKNVVDYKLKWIHKKIKLIDSKIEENKTIRYDQTNSLPTDWEYYDILQRFDFIKENLNDCKIKFFI